MFHRFTRLGRVLAVIAVTAAAGASWSGAAVAAQRPAAATGGPAGRHPAAAAPAKVSLTPTLVTAGSTGNRFTFKISAVAALSGHTSVTIPGDLVRPADLEPGGPWIRHRRQGHLPVSGEAGGHRDGPVDHRAWR